VRKHCHGRLTASSGTDVFEGVGPIGVAEIEGGQENLGVLSRESGGGGARLVHVAGVPGEKSSAELCIGRCRCVRCGQAGTELELGTADISLRQKCQDSAKGGVRGELSSAVAGKWPIKKPVVFDGATVEFEGGRQFAVQVGIVGIVQDVNAIARGLELIFTGTEGLRRGIPGPAT
jgi:hypothetical protein